MQAVVHTGSFCMAFRKIYMRVIWLAKQWCQAMTVLLGQPVLARELRISVYGRCLMRWLRVSRVWNARVPETDPDRSSYA